MKHITTILFLLISIISLGQTKYCSKTDNELIINKTYITISYNKEYKIPNYVGYYITPKFIIGNTKREGQFYADMSIPKQYRTYSSSYTNSGYDRGHMSPAADWKFNKIAMYESFSMANICPQKPILNRQYWESIEELERQFVKGCDTLYVVSGEIVDKPYYKAIKINNGIVVPDYFYKACMGLKNGNIRVSIGWLMENTGKKQEEYKCRYSIDQLEKIIKKDLFKGFWFNEKEEHKIITF